MFHPTFQASDFQPGFSIFEGREAVIRMTKDEAQFEALARTHHVDPEWLLEKSIWTFQLLFGTYAHNSNLRCDCLTFIRHQNQMSTTVLFLHCL